VLLPLPRLPVTNHNTVYPRNQTGCLLKLYLLSCKSRLLTAGSGASGQKGGDCPAYLTPFPHTREICLDELGPPAVKTYPWAQWKVGHERVTVEPDYGRRGKWWVNGAFEPASGQAALVFSAARDSLSHIQLLEHMMIRLPADRRLVIEDNLSTHTSRETQQALLAWPEIQVQ
jgi:hypothetical protein